MQTAESKLLEGLNPEQKEAVATLSGPLLILAGAGSGKTRVLTRRIAYLLEQGCCRPGEILAITFTNKAAREMQERVAELIGPRARTMWIGTFHSMFARILRSHAELLGYTGSYSITDTADQQQMIRDILRELGYDEKQLEPRSCLNFISRYKNQLKGPDQALAEQRGLEQRKAAVYSRYQERLKRSNCMDFDDLLMLSVRLFQEQPELRAQYQERFRHILVDEYQDTNHAQYQLIRLLGMGHRNVCVVGDDDQSIYGFRGADVRNILDFEKDYPECRVIKLERNYRSTAHILEAANTVIANNQSRKAKRLWTEQDKGERVQLIRARNHFDESRYIAQEIERLRKGGAAYRDCAILYRINALSRQFEQALREEGIPYRIYGGLRFYDRKEIKDALAYLRLIASERDELAFLRAIAVPKRGIGEQTLEQLRRLSALTGLPLLGVARQAETHPDLKRQAAKLKTFAAVIDGLRDLLLQNSLPFDAYIQEVLRASGLEDELQKDVEAKKERAAERQANVQELLSDIIQFARLDLPVEEALESGTELRSGGAEALPGAQTAASVGALEDLPTAELDRPGAGPGGPSLEELLEAFLARTALYSELDKDADQEEGTNFVHLMTVHASKGLEFPYVFLPAMEVGVFPGKRALVENELEEERRLAYVAITRAQRKLYILTAQERMLYGQREMNPPSPFVEEIPEHCLQRRGLAAAPYGGSSQPASAGARSSDPASASARGPWSSGRVGAGGWGRPAGEGPDPRGLAFLRGGRVQGAKAAQQPAVARAQAGPAKTYLRSQDLEVGLRVANAKWGEGRLESFTPMSGDAIVVVKFDQGPQRRLMLSMAKLWRL